MKWKVVVYKDGTYKWLKESEPVTPDENWLVTIPAAVDEQPSDKDKDVAGLINQIQLRDTEIERLKGLLKDVVFDYNQQKYLRIDIRLTDENYKDIWEIYSIDNNL